MPLPSARRGGDSFVRLLAPPLVGGALLAILVGIVAGWSYALVLLVVVAVVAAAIVLVHLRGRTHGPDGSRSSDASSPHQGFDRSPLGDTDQLSSADTTGSTARDRAAAG